MAKRATKAELAEAARIFLGEELTAAQIRGSKRDELQELVDFLEEYHAEDRRLAEANARRLARPAQREAARAAATAQERLDARGRASQARMEARFEQKRLDDFDEFMKQEQRAASEKIKAREKAAEERQTKRKTRKTRAQARLRKRGDKKFASRVAEWAGDSKIKKGLGGLAKGGRFAGGKVLAAMTNPYVAGGLLALEARHLMSTPGETEEDQLARLLLAGDVEGDVAVGADRAIGALAAGPLQEETTLSGIGSSLMEERMDQLSSLNSLIEGKREILGNIGVQTPPSIAEAMARRGLI